MRKVPAATKRELLQLRFIRDLYNVVFTLLEVTPKAKKRLPYNYLNESFNELCSGYSPEEIDRALRGGKI